MQLWRGFIEEQAAETLENLNDRLSNQTEFARFARQIIEDLGYGDQLGDDPDAPDDETRKSPPKIWPKRKSLNACAPILISSWNL
jgi:cobalamin biosynthesis protein CobT